MARYLYALLPLLLATACTGEDKGGSDTETPITFTDEDGDGFYAEQDDCDDSDLYVYPGALESCDEVDNNCDGVVDEGVQLTYYADVDGDGFGDPDAVLLACSRPEGSALTATDCDDSTADISPVGVEICDGIDNDCDELIDDADDDVDLSTGLSFFADADGDGYGGRGTETIACAAGDGAVENEDDCDDENVDVNPDASEVCDGVDNDCDGLRDGDDDDVVDTITAYSDADGDGYGDPGATIQVCEIGDGAVLDASDCDDAEEAVNPAATESCRDEIDNNCDGEIAELCESTCGDLNVLQYFDSFTTGSTPFDGAASILGATLSSSSSSTTFAADYSAGTWDVVVIDVPGSALPTDVLSTVKAAISDGAVVLFAYWYLGYESSTASLLGVTVDSSYTTPKVLSAADGTDMWDFSEDLPDKISTYAYDAGTNGTVLSPVDSTTSTTLAIYDGDSKSEAIIATYDGQVIVNGFLPWDFQTTDDDADGVYDMAELYVNEIAWATGCSP